ncbi:MAG TPA: exodeoxyribonuclease V subunit gamma [Rhodanobacteraceae bacterium]
MFQLYYDTQLERLADQLAGLLAHVDAEHLLAPQTILVPQAGLQRWLVQRLAEKHGIAANLEFIAPAQMVWRALRAWQPQLPYRSPFDREAMRWRLLPLLAQPPADEPGVAALLDGETEPVRRFQLAAHVAHLFERYQAYRRDLLDGWQHGDEPSDAQAGLWRALTQATDVPSRSRLLGDYLARFAAEDAPCPPGLPARLFAFGCINVSPDVLRFLGVLGRHADMHFFLPTPCREYWGDIPRRWDKRAHATALDGSFFNDFANPLLVSMGGVGRDFVAQVFGYDEVQPDVETLADGAVPARDTLLHRVQADVIELATAADADRLPAPDPADDSLRVNVCHSPMREVEVLHDQLLDLFQRHPDLEPRDVAVLVADMGKYAPCVDAVFGAIERTDTRCIPWTIADRPVTGAHALAALFETLLSLPASRLGLDEVLDIVAVPAVARGCGLADMDLDDLRETAMAAGICCDEDAADRAAQGIPAHAEFSWAFGRERVLLGYALGGDADDTELVCNRAPLADIEGDRAVAFGQLLRVQHLLRGWRTVARQPHTPQKWQELLNRVLDGLVPQTSERGEERVLEMLRQTLAQMAESAADADFAEPVDWRCLRDYLRETLAATPGHQAFLAGGVSVCGMVPLRNVPFRVICVLGLDAPSFPRQDPADAMSRLYGDLMDNRRRLGDRSMREDDRYLFLQTLMAARDVLYLSYVGLDERDGSAIEPSVLVSELLDIVCRDYFVDAAAARKALVTRHPLQPFSPRLFAADESRLFTYRHEWREAAGARARLREAAPFADVDWPTDGAVERFDVADLKAFFAAPQKYFLERCVGLAMADVTLAVPGREPLLDDNLHRAVRERALVARAQATGAEPADAREWARAHGLLPPLALGNDAFDDSLGVLAPQLAHWRARGATPTKDDACHVVLASGRLIEGRLNWRDSEGVAGWIGSARQGKNWMRWWLEALLVAADGKATGLALGRGDKDTPMPRALPLPTPGDAKATLDTCLNVFVQGCTRPLPLPPRTGWAWVMAMAKKGDKDKAMEAALKAWDEERGDPWIGLALRAWQPDVDERFVQLAQAVYRPLLDALQQGARA